jgi:hypothetical protein
MNCPILTHAEQPFFASCGKRPSNQAYINGRTGSALLIINNLTIIIIHTTYSILLFTDFYNDMFRSLCDHLQVVSSNFGYSQPCFAVSYSY